MALLIIRWAAPINGLLGVAASASFLPQSSKPRPSVRAVHGELGVSLKAIGRAVDGGGEGRDRVMRRGDRCGARAHEFADRSTSALRGTQKRLLAPSPSGFDPKGHSSPATDGHHA